MEKTYTTELKQVTLRGAHNNNVGALAAAQEYIRENELWKRDVQITTKHNEYGVMTATIHYFEMVESV